ncbi:MAG: glucose 1-dehydrogenase [Chloroflexota bacterium]|nr:glucose 1-dehydrogenase [Chloroflexota bacterium]
MSVFDLTDKVAVVTGGGSGIGRSIALEFAKAGANVVVASRRADVIDKAAAEIQGLGRRSLGVQTDVIQAEQVQALVSRTLEEFGTIDILVNNAGGAAAWAFDKMSPRGWDVILSINLKGTFLCSQAVGKLMVERKQGKIINIASVAGLKASPGSAHYGAAKAGVINLTKSLASLWAPDNVYVNCIAPGLIDTEAVRPALALEDPERMAEQARAIPLGRVGRPEDIAYVAVFLASPASDFMTGQTLVVDGGSEVGR